MLFVVTEDWYFCSHRLAHAAAASRAGYQVAVATRVVEHGERIKSTGVGVIPFEMTRRGFNPVAEALTILRLARLYKEYQPDIVHHVALKPVVYGSIAARVARIPVTINAVSGLGYAFTSSTGSARVLRFLISSAMPRLVNRKGSRVITQNPDDYQALVNIGVDPNRVSLILGAGVDPNEFPFQEESTGPVTVTLASRMIWAKGIQAFVDAAKDIKRRNSSVRFVLVGRPDLGNPASVSQGQLRAWASEGLIEWMGHRSDMAEILSASHIVCLPSTYGEGIPKVLIEAAATGRPIVASDIPGCREVVRNGESGYLVPPSDHASLVKALEELVADASKRRMMGQRGRQLFEENFSLERVIGETLGIYREAMNE
ncbi:MAG: glycosyltransferase family 4 protein [Betaproteobacteria bacterium]|nr:MAG: glycosyltransferase family 4 protein [Betaproteobacteria bacterium]